MALHKYCKLSVYYDNGTGCAKLKERDNDVWSCAIDMCYRQLRVKTTELYFFEGSGLSKQ